MHVAGIPAGESDDALAHTLANFLHTLALSEAASHWSMTTLRGRLVKIGARIVRQGRSITFQMAEVPDGGGYGAAPHVPANPRRDNGAASIAPDPMLRGRATDRRARLAAGDLRPGVVVEGQIPD
jgi:hypothetical protein